ncbi:hypothetical protein V1525DRAFT_456436 [Lipomyces kononenkoae]|uniref:Uncharacterized protein n=1 Tax=Lipomyces kononenkoae TaxID=34357 RepID=A0ACC3T1T4_LIPKO
MASSVENIDNEEKTTVNTLITILGRLRERSHDAIPIANALLDEGYDANGMSNDLWTHLTNTYAKRSQLSQFLAPVGGTWSRVTSLRGVTPRTSLTWDDVVKRFENLTFLDEITRWTRPFYVHMLINMKTRGRTPTPTNRSTASRPKDLKNVLLVRDGRYSVVGRIMDDAGPMPSTPPAHGMATLQVAHIIPFNASRRIHLRTMLSKFVGQDMENLLTGNGINDPSNALLLDPNTHQAFDAFKFGLECQDDRYFLRILVSKDNSTAHTSRSGA